MELSSQMNFHTFLQLSALRDRAMGTSRNETNKNLSIFRCSVKSVHSNYFEGILQLRNPTQAVLDFVQQNVSRQEGVFMSKQLKVKNGWDLYLSSQRFMRKLGKMLQEHFGGELIVSAKLFTRHHQTSREVYRVNVLFRLYPFKKGQVVVHRGENLKILFLGKKVGVKNMDTGKRMQLPYAELG